MDWVKVARALDNEWWCRSRTGTLGQLDQKPLLADIAFMLRDCLVAGMSEEDKERVYAQEKRELT